MRKLILFVLCVILVGCSSMPQKMSSVQTSVPANYQELGESNCKSCSFILFDVIPLGFGDLSNKAYNCAIANKNGDGLINTTVKNNWFYGFVGTGYCIEVSGTVIKKVQ